MVAQFAVNVKVFGLFREAVGKKEVAVILSGDAVSVADLRKQLNVSYPQLASTKAYFIVTVNRHVAPDSTQVALGDEVAIMPLVSGG